jgi:ATP-dependent exoDNAse (exonuclease V) beta subunit
LDLIAYDAEGNIIIFDFKTHHNSNISELKGKWARQTSVYKTLIQQFLESKGI